LTRILFFAVALAVFAPQCFACHRVTPDMTAPEQYNVILLGRVTGVHLAGYENSLLARPDGEVEGVTFNITDGSAPVTLRVVPVATTSGDTSEVRELNVSGCGARSAELKARGLFFVSQDGDSAIPVWESDGELFATWLQRLGWSGR
jgi:hypothetical protein